MKGGEVVWVYNEMGERVGPEQEGGGGEGSEGYRQGGGGNGIVTD